ncbi:nucleotide-binding domain containing protein [Achromobacter insuavis]
MPLPVAAGPRRPARGLDADTVAQRLGAAGRAGHRRHPRRGVVATGGDGARQVLLALGAGGIALVDEVMGGVPLGTLTEARPTACPW